MPYYPFLNLLSINIGKIGGARYTAPVYSQSVNMNISNSDTRLLPK